MSEGNLQEQINELTQKVDLLVEYMTEQRLKANVIEDLGKDLYIIGKDVYDTAVVELDNQGVEFDMEEAKIIGVKLIKNLGSIRLAVETIESLFDLTKDIGPIANEMIIDFTHTLNELDQKGYPGFIKESANFVDSVVTNFGEDGMKQLTETVVPMIQLAKDLIRPESVKAAQNAVNAINSVDFDSVKPVSMWKLFKEMRSVEMRKFFGFTLAIIKNMFKKQD